MSTSAVTKTPTISGIKMTPLRRADIPELSGFLIDGFGVPATTTCFSQEVLAWKYFDGPAGPSAETNCSLVSRSAGKIVGHIGICPRQFVVSGNAETTVSTIHAIDWLGSREHSGSGAFLMLQAFGNSQTQYAVGGSDLAQAVFPRLGFETKPAVAVFHKILAPLHRLRTRDQGFFRKWAGTAKDIGTALKSRARASGQVVELRPASVFTPEVDGLQQESSHRIVASRRDHLLLNYFLRYPLPGLSGWTIHAAQQMIGFALLKVTADGRIRQGKIVDCWLDTEDPSCWQATVAGLIDQLRTFSADFVTCFGTTAGMQSALLWNGFRKAGERNVYVRDKQQCLPRDLPLGFSMLEADLAIH